MSFEKWFREKYPKEYATLYLEYEQRIKKCCVCGNELTKEEIESHLDKDGVLWCESCWEHEESD